MSNLVKVAGDEFVEEVFRLRLLYGYSIPRIARKLNISEHKARELAIAASYWGLGFKDGWGKKPHARAKLG